MVDINEEIKKIEDSSFFEKMGIDSFHEGDVILIENVRKVFIKPSDDDFKGLYKKLSGFRPHPLKMIHFMKNKLVPKNLLSYARR